MGIHQEKSGETEMSSKEVNCPNCNAETEAIFFDAHDDTIEESECGGCGAEFAFTITIQVDNIRLIRMMPMKCRASGCSPQMMIPAPTGMIMAMRINTLARAVPFHRTTESITK